MLAIAIQREGEIGIGGIQPGGEGGLVAEIAAQFNQQQAVIGGSQSRELFMVYDWKLTRQKDKKTLTQPSVTQISCPNCGAPLNINHTGKCPYCGTVVTLSDHDWALSVIKGISQRTVG